MVRRFNNKNVVTKTTDFLQETTKLENSKGSNKEAVQ